MTAPPLGINDISANDILNGNNSVPSGLTVTELYTPERLHSFWRTPIRRTKMLKKGLISLTSIGQVRRFIDKENIDVLLVYNLPQVPLLALTDQSRCRAHFDLADDLVAMMRVEDKVVANAGGMMIAQAVQNFMISRASTVTVASTVLEERIKRSVLMLPNGADLAELDQASGDEWRSRADRPTVGFVGAFEYWVDFDFVLQVARRLPNINFLLVGSGRRMTYLKMRIAQFGLTNIILTGAVPYHEAMNYVAGMDVCLLPFAHNAVADGSCPLKLFEYGALRKPIVSTSTREVRRIGDGWISFADDSASFASAIESLLADRQASAQAGEAGRAVVEKFYNWTNLARQFEVMLEKGAVPSIELAVSRRAISETLESGFETAP
jgi:glycosyltransferase involved in cell wall biosynthesis